ncbi:uncharacterized protein sS8_5160 [Methylocaldum marinum]|uniref:Uncharacterized protein n=1 Tax=Methylocaldum marinum TaxID=1432792 RepID=A0A250KZR2_9GAMM|nr:hypothetical protein [Methylocaldum marinum]BBA37082.1 uncharacterized protein sS8_5160 [Methylocaldum marinum]
MTGPYWGYTANAKGYRFINCDYWSGQMMLAFYNELQGVHEIRRMLVLPALREGFSDLGGKSPHPLPTTITTKSCVTVLFSQRHTPIECSPD